MWSLLSNQVGVYAFVFARVGNTEPETFGARSNSSGPDPGGSDRSSGADPVLTQHPARRETRRDFRPIRSASGGVGRPGG